ncbi:ferrous iron transport protein A [bacterium]|nr:MAG: ferrous iron transport protein A [bacterium]
MLLSDIKKPGKHLIKAINGTGTIRLLEMGLTPGMGIEVIRTAPLGYPIEIKVRGYMLSLREEEATCIELD